MGHREATKFIIPIYCQTPLLLLLCRFYKYRLSDRRPLHPMVQINKIQEEKNEAVHTVITCSSWRDPTESAN